MAEVDNVRKFLDFLGRAEGANYNTIVGGSSFSDYSKHPRVVGVRTKEGPSTAAGRYQITATTYDEFAPKLGINDFSEQSQDKIALAIIQKEGALEDVRSGNFESAINKLGKRWASLPSSPYSQPKKSWEWVRGTLGQPMAGTPSPALQNGLTNPRGVVPSVSPGQQQLLMGDLQKEAKYDGFVNTAKNTFTAIEYGFKNENNAYNFIVEQGAAKADPNFTLDKEKFKAAYGNLPEDYRGYVAAAVSDDDLARRIGRVQDAVKRQQELANMGAGLSFLGAGVGTILDVDSLLMAVPVAGEFAMANKGRRIGNAIRTGLVAGGVNAGSEAAFGGFRPTSEESDIYWAGLFGLGFGGAAGFMRKPGAVGRAAMDALSDQENKAKWAQKQMADIQRAEIADAGLELSDWGKDFFKRFDADLEQVKTDAITSFQKAADEIIAGFKAKDFDTNIGKVPDDVAADAAKPVDDTTIVSKIRDEDAAAKTIPTFEKDAYVGRNFKGNGKTTAGSLLNDLASNQDPLVSSLAKRLMEQLRDDVKVIIRDKLDRSYYNTGSHEIHLRKTAEPWVQLHEIAHAVTANKIRFGKANPNTAHGQLTSELTAIYNEVKRLSGKEKFSDHKTRYYLKNIDEFVAGIYSGKSEFIDFLARTQVKAGTPVLTQIVDVIRKLMGMEPSEVNALTKALGTIDRLIDEPLKVDQLARDSSGKSRRFSYMLEPGDEDLLPAPGKAPAAGFWQGPAYENFFNREWVPTEVKSFVRSIFGSTSGYKDHSVVTPAAMDQKRALTGQWQNQFAKTLQPAINDFLERNPVPFLKRGEVMDKWNEDLGDYIRGIPGDYDPSIIKVGNEWRRLSKEVVDHINNPGKFNGDVKQGLTQTEIIDPETGTKALSDPLDYNDNYLPRIPDTYKITNMISQFGRETVERFVGNMFRSANGKISEELAEKLGRWYLKSIEEAKVNRASELVDNLLRGFDRVGFKDSLIKTGGLTPQDADRVIASMSKQAKGDDVGALNSSLKRRSILDETYTETIRMADGTVEKISYKDLFDTDTVGMINNYFNKQGGAISLANHTGLYRVNDVNRVIAEITSRDFGSSMTDEQLTKMRKHLKDIVDLTLGRPLEDFTTVNKSLQMLADYNVLTKAGLFVLNQITEMSQLLGSPMWRSVLKSVPELGSLIRNAKTGKVDNEVIDALENLSGGPGTQLLRDNPLTPERQWVREKGNTKFNQWLDKTDNLLKRGTHNLFKYTGMTPVMMMQQRTLAVAFVNHLVDHAVNGKKLGYTPDRLAWMGMEASDVSEVMSKIKQYHTAGKSRLGTVDFTKWSQDDPKSFSKFIVAYQRESSRVIQENDLASMVPIMGKQIGRTVFQFMGFPLQAWNKSMLFALNHRDMATLNTVMWAIGFNALMYTARTQMQMAGMSSTEAKEFADKRLSTQQIMLNAVGRIPQLSVMPNIFDTVSPVPLFSGMRTSTDMTDFISGNPTLSLVSGALSSTKKVVRNSLSDEYQTTEKDVKKMFQLMPLNNVIGVSNFVNSVAADYPYSEQEGE